MPDATRTSVNKGLGIVLAVVIVLILTAFAMPVAFNAMNTEVSETISVSEGNTTYLDGTGQGITGDDISETDETAEFSVTNDTYTFGFSDAPEGASYNETINGVDYTITFEGYENEDVAALQFEYANSAAMGSGTGALFAILPLIGMLVVFLTMIGWAVKAY